MRFLAWALFALALEVQGGAIGQAWDISPTSASENADPPSWPRLESASSKSALDVRSISGVGRLAIADNPQEMDDVRKSKRDIEDFEYDEEEFIENPSFADFLRSRRGLEDVEVLSGYDYDRSKRNVVRVANPPMHHFTESHASHVKSSRSRRDAASKLEQIGASKNVREARLNSPETWSKQPFSVEFRHHANLDQLSGEKNPGSIGRPPPRIDFVTNGHRRDFGEGRESRAMPDDRNYENYVPAREEKNRERDYDAPIPRGYYPDRVRSDRDFYIRRPSDSPYYYSRYFEEDVNPYGRAYAPSSPKPKRVIYYARLPEIARRPVDLRNYRYPYDDVIRSPAVAVASASSYSRAPENDYRYRTSYPYEPYRPYKRDPYKRPYSGYQSRVEDHGSGDRAALKENPDRSELKDENSEKNFSRDDSRREGSRLPWPVQIAAEVSVKDDHRISGRKIFGQIDDYDRYRKNEKLQNAPDKGSLSNDQNNNNKD